MTDCRNCIYAGYPEGQVYPDTTLDNEAYLKASEELLKNPIAIYPCTKLNKTQAEVKDCDVATALVMDEWDIQGTFETAGKLIATDPCYEPGTWCAGVVNAVPGKWYAAVMRREIDDWGKRIHELLIWHESLGSTPPDGDWAKTDIDGGVDSGQFGFFDASKYKGREDDESFYDRVCKLTLRNTSVGLIEFGAVSSSGFGDGSYPVYVLTESVVGMVTAAKAVYVDMTEEEEEEEVA